MLNKVLACIRRYDMIKPGDTVICAVSGGADSVALLWSLYLLRQKMDIHLKAAHFNHHLRGEESDRDEAFVRKLCDRYDIPLYVGSGEVKAGKKGLEAAARDARYSFFATLPGKIATAHTADDNAETVLMRMVRGTGLKGLGGIAPVRDQLIRPMLLTTRQQVLAFLEEYCLDYVTDSSNEEDAFLRNRLRHHVMPLLRQENPRLAENLSAMALRLREEDALLESLCSGEVPEVPRLRAMSQAARSRAIVGFLQKNGVKEPSSEHISLVENLVFSENPSARADMPGGVVISRQYDRLTAQIPRETRQSCSLSVPGRVILDDPSLAVSCEPSEEEENTPNSFCVTVRGEIVIRSRQAGDTIRLPGGRKSLKKLFIDRKIPAALRMRLPVVADDEGVLGVYGIGANLDRVGPGVRIRFEEVKPSESCEEK